MKIIKVKIEGNESIYIIKRKSLFSRKHEIYWVSQNMALPVVDVSGVQYESEGKRDNAK